MCYETIHVTTLEVKPKEDFYQKQNYMYIYNMSGFMKTVWKN